MAKNIEITEEKDDDVCRFSIKGRIDSNTADTLLERLQNAIKEGEKAIILNMFHVDYLSSIGIRVILQTYKQAKEKGISLNIAHPSETVKNVLGMVAIKEMLITD